MKRPTAPIRDLAPTAPRPLRAGDLARTRGGVESWNAWWHQDPATGGGGPSGS
jgi:hypothetical protein